MGEILTSPEFQIDYGSNKDRYHEVFGGRKGYFNPKYADTPSAYEAREILSEMAIEARKKGQPGTLTQFSDEISEKVYKVSGDGREREERIKISQVQLSRAAAGTLSNKPSAKYNGKSPEYFIMMALWKHYKEKYGNEIEYYI